MDLRRALVRAVRQGMSPRKVARRFDVALSTVQYWVKRAEGLSLRRVDWSDRSHRPCRTTRTTRELEDLVLAIRVRLNDESALGHIGADAIRIELVRLDIDPLPSRTTVGRILKRRGAVEPRRRVRHPSPPPGWYLPEVACGAAELDSFDHIEDLAFQGGSQFCVLTGISLHGRLPAAFPDARRTTAAVCAALVRHWRRYGLPDYVQFDNGVIFHGPHLHPDTVGRVTRLCLSLGIVVVFAPVREHGPQNLIESFNARWQKYVWRRFEWRDLAHLRQGSDRYLTAVRRHHATTIADAPARRPFPDDWQFDVDAPLRGTIIYLRRLDDDGCARLLGHEFPVDPAWAQRLVRAEVRLDRSQIVFFGLNRRHPHKQPRLKVVRFKLPQKSFRG